MKGIFIVLEISNLQQYLIVDAPAANDMVKNCERCMNSALRAEMIIAGSFLIFSIQAELDNAAAATEAAENLLEIINGYSEEIHEYSMMMLYRKNSSSEKIEEELKQTYFTIAVDRALLIENRVAEAAGVKSLDDSVPGFKTLRADEHFSKTEDSEKLRHLTNPAEVSKLVRLMVPELGIEPGPQKFILSGGSELIVRLHINEAVNEASGKGRAEAIYIDILDDETDVTSPFLRSIDKNLIPMVEGYLEGVELKTWRAGKYRFEHNNSDYPEEYFFSTYCLYLKGVLRSFKEALQPPVIIFTGLKKTSDTFLRYAVRILEYLNEDSSPFVFIIGEDNEIDFKLYDYFSDTREVRCGERIEAPDRAGKLSYLNSRLLYILDLFEGIFEAVMMEDFLIKLGFSQSEIALGLRTLESEGCIIVSRYVKVVRTRSLSKLADKISEKEEIFNTMAVFLSENIYSGRTMDYGRSAVKLAGASDMMQVGAAVFKCLTVMLDYGRSSFVLNYLAEYKQLVPVLSDALELRCFLIEYNKTAGLNVLKGFPDNPESPTDMNNSLLLLEASRYFYAMSDYQRALDYVKKVLIFLQEGDFPRLEGTVFIELGVLMLCKGKLLESSEYLNLAVEKLTGCGDDFNLMKAYLFTAVQQYIWGSLDASLESTDKSLDIADNSGRKEWQFYIEFFKCRLFFELGRYYDAEKLLSDCLLRSEIYRDDERKKIFSAWTARACIYQGKIYRGINMLLSLNEDPEVLFFLSEAYYFNGNMEKAVESIEKAGSEEAYFNLGFMPLEQITWKNGFTSIEGRVLRSDKGTGVLLHNIKALQAFLLGLTGNREYGTEILFTLTRDEKISENDPYNRLYFYLYCQLLEIRQNTAMVDKLTLISKALKYLQQTSSRINNPRVRQQFMLKNYWNSRLVSEAQKEKLI
ncbi:MAG: hypothetical protein PQJ61_02035 [Spirochaetales bacterium]|uniref:MalT-like TPR region domain-containing protein n=1 Tax=Candidatus Thalassospirochaeta sargassi TaxID=3119039 RepID=A0AAJ1MJ54_9SPIO|nr:hypothetical protein [Spirochaetales bacterium]